MLLVWCAAICLSSPVQADWFKEDAAIMGTVVHVELWHDQEKEARKAIKLVFEELQRVEQLMSPYISSSELAKVNHGAAEKPIHVGTELFQLLQQSVAMSQLTEGAFDISYASVGHLYNYPQRIKPSLEMVNKYKDSIGYQYLHLDTDGHWVQFKKPLMKIDLGGIAKGYAVGRTVELLKALGYTRAYVSAGGDSYMMGDKNGRPWIMGIQDPRNSEKLIAVIPLVDAAVSTSGDYFRYFDSEGVRYHHILDPKTGISATLSRSVTIIGKNSTQTDGLSTGVFVLGPKKGMALVEKLPQIEAVIVDQYGKMSYSSGLKNVIQLRH